MCLGELPGSVEIWILNKATEVERPYSLSHRYPSRVLFTVTEPLLEADFFFFPRGRGTLTEHAHLEFV